MHRCFPPEKESRSIHRVIDFVHEKVKNALELISREEKNKSLQSFFKELNDHTTNAFEFGKQFLAFLLHSNKKVNGNIFSDVSFDGRTYETGKLHNLLESATSIVLESYVADMNLTHERVNKGGDYKAVDHSYNNNNSSSGGGYGGGNSGNGNSGNGGAGGAGGGSTQVTMYSSSGGGSGNGGGMGGGANVHSVKLDMTASAKNSTGTVCVVWLLCMYLRKVKNVILGQRYCDLI